MNQHKMKQFEIAVEQNTDGKGNINYCALKTALSPGRMFTAEKAFRAINEHAQQLPIRKEGYAAKKVACLGSEYIHVPYYVKSIYVKHAQKGIEWFEVDYLDTKCFPAEKYLYNIELEGPVLAELNYREHDAFYLEELSDESVALCSSKEIMRAREEIDAYNEMMGTYAP